MFPLDWTITAEGTRASKYDQITYYDTDRDVAEYMEHQLLTVWYSIETGHLKTKWE